AAPALLLLLLGVDLADAAQLAPRRVGLLRINPAILVRHDDPALDRPDDRGMADAAGLSIASQAHRLVATVIGHARHPAALVPRLDPARRLAPAVRVVGRQPRSDYA